MNALELFIIAIGLSMDAFAVAVSTGLTLSGVTIKKSLTVGVYFGFFQAVMPLIGYFLATRYADNITAFDHWIAFVLLVFIGGRMCIEGTKKEDNHNRISTGKEHLHKKEPSLKPLEMLPLALATSIDALAVGVSFAFLKVNILPAVFSIGVTTLLLSVAGVKIGNIFGMKFKSKAELAGGIVLILMGVKILLEHTGFISF